MGRESAGVSALFGADVAATGDVASSMSATMKLHEAAFGLGAGGCPDVARDCN